MMPLSSLSNTDEHREIESFLRSASSHVTNLKCIVLGFVEASEDLEREVVGVSSLIPHISSLMYCCLHSCPHGRRTCRKLEAERKLVRKLELIHNFLTKILPRSDATPPRTLSHSIHENPKLMMEDVGVLTGATTTGQARRGTCL